MSQNPDLEEVVDLLKDVLLELGGVQHEISELRKVAKKQKQALDKIKRAVR